MAQSEQLNELAAALSKAQAVMRPAVKDTTNPFFDSTYADLASNWSAARKPLTDNGLSVTQTMEIVADKTVLVTTLLHSSGQWIDSSLPLLLKKDDPQAQGSAISYARRYAFGAIVGLTQADDDGNRASGLEDLSHIFDQAVAQVAEQVTDNQADYWLSLRDYCSINKIPDAYLNTYINKKFGVNAVLTEERYAEALNDLDKVSEAIYSLTEKKKEITDEFLKKQFRSLFPKPKEEPKEAVAS